MPVSVTVSPIRDEGGRLIGASSIARDITEQSSRVAAELRRRADDLERANRNLETFTYSVAHDLRAPLRALGGFSAALVEECGDVLGEAGRRLRRADPGRQRADGDAYRRPAAPVPGLAGRDAPPDGRSRRRRWPPSPANCRREPGPPRPVHHPAASLARADRTLIRTVLQNLVENAWKFTSRRDDATIEFGAAPTGDAGVCCYVRDNGAGFDPAYADKLFQPFQRLHTTSEFPGTGIGLASVRQIVERHGGRVWAEGAVGEGATFYFTLDAKEIGMTNRPILLVEDNPDDELLTLRALKKNNILNEVTVAHDGAEALEQFFADARRDPRPASSCST